MTDRPTNPQALALLMILEARGKTVDASHELEAVAEGDPAVLAPVLAAAVGIAAELSRQLDHRAYPAGIQALEYGLREARR